MGRYGLFARRAQWQQPIQAKKGERYVYSEKELRDALGEAEAGRITEILIAGTFTVKSEIEIGGSFSVWTMRGIGGSRIIPEEATTPSGRNLFFLNGVGSANFRPVFRDLKLGGPTDADASILTHRWDSVFRLDTANTTADFRDIEAYVQTSGSLFSTNTATYRDCRFVNLRLLGGATIADSINLLRSNWTDNRLGGYQLTCAGSGIGDNVFHGNVFDTLDTSARSGGNPNLIMGNIIATKNFAAGDLYQTATDSDPLNV